MFEILQTLVTNTYHRHVIKVPLILKSRYGEASQNVSVLKFKTNLDYDYAYSGVYKVAKTQSRI